MGPKCFSVTGIKHDQIIINRYDKNAAAANSRRNTHRDMNVFLPQGFTGFCVNRKDDAET